MVVWGVGGLDCLRFELRVGAHRVFDGRLGVQAVGVVYYASVRQRRAVTISLDV